MRRPEVRPVNRSPAFRLASEPDQFALEGDDASGLGPFPVQNRQ
jgi:hypothetical protein